jgi:hypothetical protein
MSMMDAMMGAMMGRMSKEDKDAMMDKMMAKFFEGMTQEDKQKMMQEMMPKMMEGMSMMDMMRGMMGGGGDEGMMGMMSGMMGGNENEGTPGMMGGDCPEGSIPPMARMMEKMMPHCLEMMLPQVPKQDRTDFAQRLIKSLLDNGTSGMTEPEKKEYLQKIAESVRTAAAPA